MNLSIISDTSGAKVAELTEELSTTLEPLFNKTYKDIAGSIGIAIRCLPKNYNRKSFIRYTKKDQYLTLDFCVSLEEYSKQYKMEQRVNLGKTFLEYLEKGLDKNHFPDLDKKEVMLNILKWGGMIGWFEDEVDWSKDVEK